jgi:hypothetical protein
LAEVHARGLLSEAERGERGERGVFRFVLRRVSCLVSRVEGCLDCAVLCCAVRLRERYAHVACKVRLVRESSTYLPTYTAIRIRRPPTYSDEDEDA